MPLISATMVPHVRYPYANASGQRMQTLTTPSGRKVNIPERGERWRERDKKITLIVATTFCLLKGTSHTLIGPIMFMIMVWVRLLQIGAHLM